MWCSIFSLSLAVVTDFLDDKASFFLGEEDEEMGLSRERETSVALTSGGC